MALTHALLLSLAEQSGSGYELTNRFDRSIGYFYSATHQQIYRTLRRMEDDSWLRCQVVDQEGRPAKKVYTVAELGYRELSRWIASSEGTDMRDLALKVRAATYADSDVVVEQIRAQRNAHAAALEGYLHMQKRQFPAPDQLSGAALPNTSSYAEASAWRKASPTGATKCCQLCPSHMSQPGLTKVKSMSNSYPTLLSPWISDSRR